MPSTPRAWWIATAGARPSSQPPDRRNLCAVHALSGSSGGFRATSTRITSQAYPRKYALYVDRNVASTCWVPYEREMPPPPGPRRPAPGLAELRPKPLQFAPQRSYHPILIVETDATPAGASDKSRGSPDTRPVSGCTGTGIMARPVSSHRVSAIPSACVRESTTPPAGRDKGMVR